MATTMTRLGESREDRVFNAVIHGCLALVFVSMVYPLWFILIASFSDPNSVYNGKVLLLPHNTTLRGYELILQYRPIWIGYRNAFLYLFVGTAINLAVMVPAAYALSRKDLVGRNLLMAVFVFTMFFGGGLIPTYLLVRKYQRRVRLDPHVGPGRPDQGALMYATNDLPDAFIGIGQAVSDDYGAQGLNIALEEYIDRYAPNIKTALDEVSAARRLHTALDGHLYHIPRFEFLSRGGQVVYSSFVRTQWLAALGESVPDSVDGFVDLLRAFRDGDPNGNGQADEIPFSVR